MADFFRDGGIMLAGSLSYFFMMMVVPFSLFLIALGGHVNRCEKSHQATILSAVITDGA